MSLRLSSLSAFAAVAALFLAAACTTPAIIANGTGGAGGGAGGSTVTGSSATGTTSTAGTGTGTGTGGGVCTTDAECGCGCVCLDGNACLCTDGIPPTCAVDADCGPACAGLHCVAQKCEPVACTDTCPSAGATRCVGSGVETCTLTGGCLGWSAGVACPAGESCNSDATKCIAKKDTCATPADCFCGCTCTPQGVCGFCLGGIPLMCTTDDDCGPECAGMKCVASKCVSPN